MGMSYLAEEAIACARAAVGVQEDKPYRNRGKWIDIYTGFLGLIGVPWCACFVAFKIHQAGKRIGVVPRWPRAAWAGSCDRIYAWAKRERLLLDFPVDECVFLVGTPADYTHMGFVERVAVENGNVYVNTIEGNTNDDGSREGYAVCRRRRLAKGLTFIRIV